MSPHSPSQVDKLGSLGASGEFMADMDAHLLLFTFLPPLIFESAFNVHETHFQKVKTAALTYAGPGLLMSTTATAGICLLLYPQWEWYQAALLGALLSATDPVAVVALLKQVGTGSLLDTLIEAESLLNDGTAMVVFSVLLEVVKASQMEATAGDILLTFIQMAVMGPIFGVFMGYFFSKCIGQIFNSAEVEVTLTLCAAYLTFYIAEGVLGSSGVLAVVGCGIYMGNRGDTQISPEVEEFLGEFWELLGYIANTCIFTLTGVIIVYNDMWETISHTDFVKSLIIYASIMLIRFLVFKSLNQVINLTGAYVPSPAETYICCWGALRGAVGLALGLVVWGNKKSKGGLIDDHYSDLILFHAAMIVIITLCLNATTVAPLLKKLDLDKVDDLKDKLFRVSMEEIRGAGDREVDSLKMDELISCASWPDVRKFGTVEIKEKRAHEENEDSEMHRARGKSMKSKNSKVENDASDERSFRKHLTELRELRESRRRCLAAVKASYRNQFRHGMLSRRALHYLEHLTEKMVDDNCELGEWNEISAGHLFSRVHRRSSPIMRWMFKKKDFSNLQFGYDVVCGFFNARVDALHSMSIILGTDSAAYVHLKESINSDQEIAKRTILEVQRYLPEIAANIATLRASRSMLNAQRSATMELYEGGFLDKLEHGKVVHDIEEKMHMLLAHPPQIEMPTKYDLIKEVTWLSEAPTEIIDELTNAATETFVETDDVIIRQNETGNNLFLIARGTCKVQITNDKGEDEDVGEIGVGQVVGELAWLTNKPRQASVLAASRGIVYAISGHTLTSLMDREKGGMTKMDDSGQSKGGGSKEGGGISRQESLRVKKNLGTIRKKLWECAGWRLGENMLRYQEPYVSWDRAELRRWLVQWKLFHPQADMNIEVVRPCILLDGTCQQPWQKSTGEVTEAPFYLTPTQGTPMKLTFSDQAKLFCPPGALRTNKKGKDNVASGNKSLFQATGWNLIKDKMVAEKKEGWGKLAVNLKQEIGRIHASEAVNQVHEKPHNAETAEVEGRFRERRNSQSMLTENLHLKLLNGSGGPDNSSHSEIGSPVGGEYNSALRSKRFSTVSPEGRENKSVGILTRTEDLEKHTLEHSDTGKGKMLKELSFRRPDMAKAENKQSLDSVLGSNKAATAGSWFAGAKPVLKSVRGAVVVATGVKHAAKNLKERTVRKDAKSVLEKRSSPPQDEPSFPGDRRLSA
jgi:NhaP-type Na+/H+ or K+/H+ antiporter